MHSDVARVGQVTLGTEDPLELKVCDSGDADFALQLSVTPVISVPNRRGPHFLLSALPTTRSFHKAARGAWLREGQSVFVTRE